MEGVFQLKCASDLLAKLRFEYEQLKSSPDNAYIAFNFFVTSEHLLDWLYPNDESKRRHERVGQVLLQVCSHIANGAKHFVAKAGHHQSVSDTRKTGDYFGGMFPRGYFGGLFPESSLIIELQGDAETVLGRHITAVDLAAKVLDFWEKHPGLSTP